MRCLRWMMLAALLGPGCATEPLPNTLAAWTYPVWGLPRDLVDAPLTAINRTGFGSLVVCGHQNYISSATDLTTAVAETAGIIVWINHGFGAGVVANLVFFGYGIAATLGTDLAYGAIVNPVQVALLRPGDDRYFKYQDNGKNKEGEPTPEETSIRERSRAFFPNWRAVTAGTVPPGP